MTGADHRNGHNRLPLADLKGMTSVRPPAVARHSGMSYMTRVAYGVRVTEIPAAVAAELARLRAENAHLLKMLELSPRQAAPPAPGAGRVLRCAAGAGS